jgi:hypothetical protein
MRERAETSLEDPQAKLERALIEEYLKERGCSLATVNTKPPTEGKALLAQASLYAAGRLAEIDARAAYVHRIHDGADSATEPRIKRHTP